MVNDHSYRVACSLEIVFPFGKGMDHSKVFLVKDVIVSFCSGKSFGEEGTGVQVSIKVSLHENCPSGCERGVGHNCEGFSGVWESQNRYSFHRTRGFPFLDGSKFNQVHPHVSFLNNHA